MIKVNLLIGDKSPIYSKSQAGTGEGRHHESPFFELLKNKVEFNKIPMYNHRLPLPKRLSHILHHFIHPFTVQKNLDHDAITHIMFAEEASLLNFIKPSKTTIVTCLDLIPILQPEGLNPLNAKFLSQCIKSITKADHIIANSEFTKKEIHQHLKIPNQKITVIEPPISETFKPVDQIPSTFFEKHHLDPNKKYLLYIGALDLPRKNVKTLIQAFQKISKKFPDYELLLIGHAYRQSRLQKLKDLAAKTPTHFIENATEADLLYFYNLATLFLFPSLYEGFGLPPAEAMACGTPVISSNATSLPEVVGPAGILVDCQTPHHLVDQISSTLQDPKLLKTLSEKGLQQAKKFSWQEHSRKHNKLYQTFQNKFS